MRVFPIVIAVLVLGAVRTSAQDAQHQHGSTTSLFALNEGSGTSWLPETNEMYAFHRQAGRWEWMFHGNAFLQHLREAADDDRGSKQTGSINWLMLMGRREVGKARVGVRGMFSFEPATIKGCGYPDLLATGELCDGESIHDRQHPHDLVMELAVEFEAPLGRGLRWQLYGGPAGEPALGPSGFPHRLSAMPNPIAPISHHWLDATHITFGVLTTGVFSKRWKVEGSLFNGREPDEDRWDLDLDRLDSYSGRVSFAPTADLALQVSAGHMNDAEDGEGTLPPVDVERVTASATYHRRFGNRIWASTFAWGRNEEEGEGTHAFLGETNLALPRGHTVFGRVERAEKSAHDLHAEEFGDEVFTVGKLQAGYVYYAPNRAGFQMGIGGHVSVGLVPEDLKPRYGSRSNLGGGVFLTLRPAPMDHSAHATTAVASSAAHIMVQTAYDPAKLACTPAIDPKAAASTTYQGRTYYFCSTKERDEFMTNPAMSLSMMPPKE